MFVLQEMFTMLTGTYQGAGGKGMEVAAPPETRNLGLKELDPQGTLAVQGVEAGRGGAARF